MFQTLLVDLRLDLDSGMNSVNQGDWAPFTQKSESRLTRDVICELLICELSSFQGFSCVNRGWLNVEWIDNDELATRLI
jgi:hypothetical protein